MGRGKVGFEEKTEVDSPTAALRRLTKNIKAPTTNTLSPQTMTFAMFPSDPFWPARWIPHVGSIPTGAEEDGDDRPRSVEGECDCS